jgi:hypothetical protein
MSSLTVRLCRLSLAAALGTGFLFVNENLSLRDPGSLVTQAQAIIGRPLTPMSYAGVARRTTRREVYGAAAVGGAAAGAAAVGAAGCVRVATAYGLVTRCN